MFNHSFDVGTEKPAVPSWTAALGGEEPGLGPGKASQSQELLCPGLWPWDPKVWGAGGNYVGGMAFLNV